jgi:hypothetical protein
LPFIAIADTPRHLAIRAQTVERFAKSSRGFAELAGGHADRSCTNAYPPWLATY